MTLNVTLSHDWTRIAEIGKFIVSNFTGFEIEVLVLIGGDPPDGSIIGHYLYAGLLGQYETEEGEVWGRIRKAGKVGRVAVTSIEITDVKYLLLNPALTAANQWGFIEGTGGEIGNPSLGDYDLTMVLALQASNGYVVIRATDLGSEVIWLRIKLGSYELLLPYGSPTADHRIYDVLPLVYEIRDAVGSWMPIEIEDHSTKLGMRIMPTGSYIGAGPGVGEIFNQSAAPLEQVYVNRSQNDIRVRFVDGAKYNETLRITINSIEYIIPWEESGTRYRVVGVPEEIFSYFESHSGHNIPFAFSLSP